MKTPPADEARTVQVRAHGRSRETDRPCNSILVQQQKLWHKPEPHKLNCISARHGKQRNLWLISENVCQ